MTYTTKIRGTSTGYIVAEYSCPHHGVFSVTCSKPAPDAMPCPEVTGEDSNGLCTYCDENSEWTISAPNPKVLSVIPTAAVRGGDTERRPGQLDTRALADGQSYTDWKKTQREDQKRRRHAELVKLGIVKKKITVG